MITADSITPIGTILKTHGVKGELTMTTSIPEVIEPGVCLVMDVDGIYVPFFVASTRSKSGGSILITIDGYTTDDAVRYLTGKQVFMPDDRLRELIPESEDEDDDNIYLDDLKGMTLIDEEGRKVGVVTGYDDSTANVVLTIECDSPADQSKVVFVPFAADLFIDIDYYNRTLQLEIPEGLLEL